MSRNDLFLLLACGIVVTILSGSPPPLARSSSLTIATLLAPTGVDAAFSDSASLRQGLSGR